MILNLYYKSDILFASGNGYARKIGEIVFWASFGGLKNPQKKQLHLWKSQIPHAYYVSYALSVKNMLQDNKKLRMSFLEKSYFCHS